MTAILRRSTTCRSQARSEGLGLPAFWLLLSVVVAFTWAPVGLAESPEQDTNALTHQLMSPYCPGLLLADCQSGGARDLRAEILRRLKAGESAAAVEDDLVARFGASIRTVPAFDGIGMVAWIGPLVLGLAGLWVVVVAVRMVTRHRDPYGDPADSHVNLESPLNTRLQDELDALD